MTKQSPADEQLDECHALAVAIAPELEGTLRLFRHEADWPIRPCVAAYAIWGRNIAIRDSLRRRGEWGGEWGTFVVFVGAPSFGLTLHEIAHQLPARPPIIDYGIEPTPAQAAEQLAVMLREGERDETPKPWEGHAADWIRRTLHLHSRAWQLGYEISLYSMQIAGEMYGLSEPWAYMNALGDEPKRMANEPFKEIDSQPFPDEFIELWRADVANYYRQEKLGERLNVSC